MLKVMDAGHHHYCRLTIDAPARGMSWISTCTLYC